MTAIMVWYFLAAGGSSNIATVGPFANEQQCQQLSQWAYQRKYVSDCYQAPLATPRQTPETCGAKTGCSQ